ncbi:MAG: hypothetical protein ABI882_06165 [Acidobacteriota bacterium]
MKSRDQRIGVIISAAILLALAMPSASLAQKKKPVQSTKTAAPTYRYAYEHGYRAGYEDGFAQGKTDVASAQSRDFRKSDAFNRADRTYQERMGTYLEYQEGYRYGTELGYGDGYFGRTYSTTLPQNLGRLVTASINASNRRASDVKDTASDDRRRDDTVNDDRRRDNDRNDRQVARAQENEDRRPTDPRGERAPARTETRVPADIQMKIRLDSKISTKDSKEGDQFTAQVLDPSGYADATVTGHVAKLKKSGSATGKTELSLAFDSITLRNGRTLELDAQVEKVYESDKVKSVDDEGNVQSESRTKDTTIRTGGGAALGAIIGAIAGGGKGAAIGAAIGAGAGAGSVFIEGGKVLTLEPGTEMLIRTAGPGTEKRN